jgi:Fur family ferric uptake transcriptional regulator
MLILKARDCEVSSARELIAKEFFKTKDHITIEELLNKTRKLNPKIGIATVYRTLHLLQECGLCHSARF